MALSNSPRPLTWHGFPTRAPAKPLTRRRIRCGKPERHCMIRTLMLVLACLATSLSGCTGLGGSAKQPQFVATPGQYAPAPAQNPRLTVGVPELSVPAASGVTGGNELGAMASEELLSLMDASARFDLIEHVRLRQLLSTQSASDMLEPGRVVHPAALQGVDELLLGQIRDLSVRKEPEPGAVSVAGVEKLLNLGPGHKPKLVVSGKVDLWLVNPANAAVEDLLPFLRTGAGQHLLELGPGRGHAGLRLSLLRQQIVHLEPEERGAGADARAFLHEHRGNPAGNLRTDLRVPDARDRSGRQHPRHDIRPLRRGDGDARGILALAEGGRLARLVGGPAHRADREEAAHQDQQGDSHNEHTHTHLSTP